MNTTECTIFIIQEELLKRN